MTIFDATEDIQEDPVTPVTGGFNRDWTPSVSVSVDDSESPPVVDLAVESTTEAGGYYGETFPTDPVSFSTTGFLDVNEDRADAVSDVLNALSGVVSISNISPGEYDLDPTSLDNPFDSLPNITQDHDWRNEEGEKFTRSATPPALVVPVFEGVDSITADTLELLGVTDISAGVLDSLPTSLSEWGFEAPGFQATLEDGSGFRSQGRVNTPVTLTLTDSAGNETPSPEDFVDVVTIDLSEIDGELPLLVADSPPTIEPKTDELSATVTQQLRNDGNAPAEASFDLTISPAWKSTSATTSGSVGPVSPGGVGNLDVVVDSGVPNFGGIGFAEAAQAVENGNTGVTFEWEYSGDVPDDAEWTSGSETVDFTDALPEIPDEEPDLGPPELSIDSLLSEFIIAGPQDATDAIDVTVEHDGPATPAEDITVSGFGDSVTIDRLERGETDEVFLTPDVTGLSPDNPIQDRVVVEFDGTEQDSQPVTIERAPPDVADLDLQPISDITLSPDEGLPSSISVGVLNRGDAEGTGTVETPFGSTEVTVPPGEGGTAPTERAAIGLSGIEPPEPGDDADSYTVSLLNADGQQVATESFNIRKQIEADFDKPGLPFDAEALPLQVDSDIGQVDVSPYTLRLYIHDFSVPDGTVTMSFDWEQRYSGAVASGSAYAWSVNGARSQNVLGLVGQDGSSGTGSQGKITRTFDNLSVGDTVHAAVEWEYASESGFAQVSWDVKPIPGVTSQRGLTIADATIPDELRPGSVTPFDVSVGHGYGGALVSGDVVFYINGEEFERITVDDVFPNDPTSFTPRPPSPGSGVLSGVEPPTIITAKVETQTPSGRVVDSVSSEAVEIREPVPIDASLSPSLPNSFPATGEVELPVSVSNNTPAPLSTVVSISELDVSQTVNVPASSTETFNLGPVSVSDLRPLSELTFTSEESEIDDATVPRPTLPNPEFALSASDTIPVNFEGELSIPITVSNTGQDAGTTDVTATPAGGSPVSKEVSLAPGESQDVTLSPSPPSPGDSVEYTLTAGGAEQTVVAEMATQPRAAYNIALDSLGTVQPGEPISIVGSVTNTGDADGSDTVSVQGFDASEQVSLSPGETQDFDLDVTAPSAQGASETYTVNVGEAEEGVTATVVQLSPADFGLDVPPSVTMDEPSLVEVEATVTNEGEEAGSTEVSMLDDAEVVELDGGESTTVPLRTDITPLPGDVQEYTVELSDGTSDTVGVEFPTDIADTGRPTAEIDVQNTGGVAGSMTLLLDGNIVDSREVDAGETTTFTVEPPLPDPGTESLYEVRVRPDDDNASGDTEQFNMATDVLPEPEPPSFNLVDVIAPDESRVGQYITVDAIVENTGGESGEVTVRSDGDIRQVTIDGGSQEIVTLSLPSPFNQGFEDYEVSVGDQTERVGVDFREVEPDVPDTPELPETPEQPGIPEPPSRGPGVPARPGEGEQPYDGVFTYLDPLGVLGTSEQISLDLFGDD